MKKNNLNDLGIENLHIELIDIDNIEDVGYSNMIDISIEDDETFCINDGIISHNSAAGIAVTGISEVGRDYWGVFPLKGRPLNVREAAISKITQNEEISKILQIVGLIPGKKYKDLSELRYGKLVFMTDADHFGLSIKGLLINLIHKMWPELLDLGFCYEFITPIVIAKKGKDKKEYYDIEKYKIDKENKKLEGWSIKYYKGLGTILPVEIKEMFRNINKHLIKFNYVEDRDNDKIDMVFNKDRVPDRKEWMKSYSGEIIPNKFNKPNEINNFIDTEFIQFSIYDTIINIPHLMDGFKPTQRKIIYSAFKKNLKEEMKVAQFGSYVAEQTHYNHGENNISGTIVNMAQDITGTNNINLLLPNGGYGTRRDPKASASPRYIYTELNKLTRKIFRPEDDQILNYLYEDADQIEPEYYLPIIPMVLINGAAGIGTGWSTDIPKYNPDAIIEVLKRKIKKPELKYRINPWYKNFDGDIDFNEEKNSYITKGVYTKNKKGIQITELPIEVWTEKYVAFLDKLCDDKVIKNYIDNSTDTKVKIDVIFNSDESNWSDEQIINKLKLSSSISINNMHTFLNNKIVKWESAENILNTWFDIRLDYYAKRKQKHTVFLEKQLDKQLNVYAFIDAIIKEELIINKKTKDQIVSQLNKMQFDMFEDSYDYLLNIAVYSFSKEKLDSLKEDILTKKQNLKTYKALEPGDIWSQELDELRSELKKLDK